MMLNGFPVDYAILDDMEDPVISVNLGALIFALATYCFSVIFDYGIELQKQADEAL